MHDTAMIHWIWNITVAFLYLCIILFLLLIIIRKSFSSREKKLEREKNAYIKQFTLYLLDENATDHFVLSKKTEIIAAAEALGEIIVLLDQEKADKAILLTEKLSIDTALITFYKKAFFTAHKVYYISLMTNLPTKRLHHFYESLLSEKDIFPVIKKQALYGFTTLVSSQKDLERIWLWLKTITETDTISLKFSEFIAKSAMENSQKEYLLDFFASFVTPNKSISASLSFIAAAGDTKFSFLQENLLQMHTDITDTNSMLNTNILRALQKMQTKSCKVVNDLYLSFDTVTKITLARVGLDLCPCHGFEKLYIYLFDKNYYVRRNIGLSLIKHKIDREKIIDWVSQKAPSKMNDLYFNDFLSLPELQNKEYSHDK